MHEFTHQKLYIIAVILEALQSQCISSINVENVEKKKKVQFSVESICLGFESRSILVFQTNQKNNTFQDNSSVDSGTFLFLLLFSSI